MNALPPLSTIVAIYQGHYQLAAEPDWTGTVEQFWEANPDMTFREINELREDLQAGRGHRIGGGAAACFTVKKVTLNFAVMLGSRENTDFPPGVLRGPMIAAYMVHCDDLEHARRLCLDFIAHHDLGGGNWIGGRVHADNGRGRLVAHVAYNGRIEMVEQKEFA